MSSSSLEHSDSVSPEDFLRQLTQTELIPVDQLQQILRDTSDCDPQQLARRLTEMKLLTNYQAMTLLSGLGDRLILNNYVLLDELGAGGMGLVFRAMHRRMERIVAIKLLRPENILSENSVARFHREVKATARLVHPNVVTAFDADVAGDTHYMVMEYVDGCDLSKLVQANGPLTINQGLHCVVQAAEGLRAAHESGIFHRDVKPGNLVLDRNGVVRILDMGLAQFDPQMLPQLDARLTMAGQIMGTHDFISPEQINSPETVDVRSDIYSLGCTLYALLTGNAIFDAKTTIEKLTAHQHEEIPALSDHLPGVPPILDLACRCMVAKSQAERPQSMNEVITVLSKCFLPDEPRQIPLPENRPTTELDEYLRARDGGMTGMTDSVDETQQTIRLARPDE